MRNYYNILGVLNSATTSELKHAYRQLAIQCHPDKTPNDPEARGRFQLITEAYSILSHPQLRADYDRKLQQTQAQSKVASEGANEKPERKQKGKGRKKRKTNLSKYRRSELNKTARNSRSQSRPKPSKIRSTRTGVQDFGSVLSDLLMPPSRRRSKIKRPIIGSDLHQEIELTLKEVAQGIRKTIGVTYQAICENCEGDGTPNLFHTRRCNSCAGLGWIENSAGEYIIKKLCQDCNGNGRQVNKPCEVCKGAGRLSKERLIVVGIKPGIREGTILRVPEQGNPGASGAQTGDLFLGIKLVKDPFFGRDGDDITCEISIDFVEAILGGSIEVPTLEGKINLKVPSGIQFGQVLRVPGRGLPGVIKTGDQVITVKIKLPTEITPRQKKLLEMFRGDPITKEQSEE